MLVAIHSLLVMWGALRHSPPWDEVAHLPAGISHWQLGTFTLHRVNPPLVRLVASAPVLLMNPAVDWTGYDESVGARCERSIRGRFL